VVGILIGHFLSDKLNLDLVTGVCFVVIAVLMALGVALPLSGD
jgi:hypothetical protein